MLLKPAQNQTAYLKAGILGFQGSGKTFTASLIAEGLAKASGKDKPKLAMFDTEKGSDFLVQRFADAGVQFDVAKSRSFSDLLDFMKEVEKEQYDVVIIDSISHVWNELRSSYERKLRRSNGLLFQDWGKVKGEWQQFTDAFINSKVHVLVLGRAGYDYDFSEDESGKKELIKTGTKMKAEGEFGYESDILLEMERIKIEGKKGWVNRCTVLKDRTNTMNGKEIDRPTYNDFQSVIKSLNIGGEHLGVDTTRNSEDLFESPDRSLTERIKQRDIALDELQETLVLNELAGTAAGTVKKRMETLIKVFGTSSKTAIENMRAEEIRAGIEKIKLLKEEAPVADGKEPF